MILYKTLVLLFVFLNFSFVRTENTKHCYYSRYMLLFFKLHEIYFELHFKNCKQDSSTLKKLETYDGSLRSQSQNIMVILDDLMTQNDQSPVQAVDLMAVSLYLNNVFDSLLVRTFDGKNVLSNHPDNKAIAYIKELKKSCDKIVKYLITGINENCPLWSDNEKFNERMILRDPRTQSQGYNHLNTLLPDNRIFYSYSSLAEQFISYMDAFNDGTLEMKYLLRPIFNRNTFDRYHPKAMLFYGLLFRAGSDPEDLLIVNEPDDLQLLRQVTLATKLEDGTYPDMEILFSMVQRCYDVKCVQSFQQQVLAATAHPVLSVVGWYATLVEHMFYTGSEKFKDVAARAELFEERINDLGDSVLNTFVAFIRLAIFPESVLDYFRKTALELDNLVKCTDKENIQSVVPKWIGQIYRRCSNPMVLNKLRVSKVEEFISVNTEENCIEAINMLNKEADKVGEYVKALEEHKKHYHKVVSENPFFSHENMFLYEPECNIIRENKHGYKILVGSRPNVKLDQEPHLIDN